jgi:23S rRNA methylase
LKKNKISKDWINRRRKDIYIRQSKIEGYKSRAIYKLKEIDEK